MMEKCNATNNNLFTFSQSSPAYLHYTLFPASDHFLLANLEPERLVSVTRRVKLPSVCERACKQGNGKMEVQCVRETETAAGARPHPAVEKASHYP